MLKNIKKHTKEVLSSSVSDDEIIASLVGYKLEYKKYYTKPNQLVISESLFKRCPSNLNKLLSCTILVCKEENVLEYQHVENQISL